MMAVPSKAFPGSEHACKLKIAAKDLPELLAAASQRLHLDGEVDMSLVGDDSDAEPVMVTSLDEVPQKAKVQFWPKGLYGGSAITAPSPRKIVMLIETNELFEMAQKVVVENAQSVEDLIASACGKLDQAGPVTDYVLSVGGVAVGSLDDVPDKTKVTITAREPSGPPPAVAEEETATVTFADDSDGSKLALK